MLSIHVLPLSKLYTKCLQERNVLQNSRKPCFREYIMLRTNIKIFLVIFFTDNLHLDHDNVSPRIIIFPVDRKIRWLQIKLVHSNKYLGCPSCVVSNALASHRCDPRSTFLIDRGCIWKGTVVGCLDTLVFYRYSHTNDPLTLTSLPTRYSDISCRTFFFNLQSFWNE